jgi:PAS domain S-box-containing protein
MAENLTGWSRDEAVTQPINAVFHIVNENTRKRVDNPVIRVLREGMIVGLANHTILVRKDKTEVPIDDSGAPIRDKDGIVVGVVLVFRDITESKRAEEEANHLASFPAFNPNPVLEVDLTGTITFCNDGACRILRDLGLPGDDCRPFLPEDLYDILQGWDRQNETVLTREVPVKDRIFEETIVLFPTFRVARIYAFDITGRKLREDRIGRLTRLYAMLSRANEVIVRARDKASLYAELCRTIAEEGAFPLVWIGQVRGVEIVPVARSGPARAYLDGVRVEVDGLLGQGPTGVCVRENRPVVNHDFDVNAATKPWREQALRYGFRVSAAFPLPGDHGLADVLTIYASHPHDLDAEQVGLLEGLAADISYALDTMEKEKLRARAEIDLQHSLKRFELLAHTAGELLRNPDSQKLINSLCKKVMEHLDCHAFFNFLVVHSAGRLRLNAYAGIPEEEARRIEWLDYGMAVCGCAARDRCRVVSEHIPVSSDPRTELVRSYGIKAYACHPLFGPDEEVLGTLSFGSRSRETFSEEDLSLMKAVADQVAVAMIRMRDEETVKKARDRLEERVMERTAELQDAYDRLMRETEEREKVERQLRQAQKMEALGTLAGGIAHDFNNILAAIIGFTELVKERMPEESREHRHAQRVLEAGIRGRELVRQMLTFSRQTEQEKKPLRLSTMIKEGVKLLRASIPSTVNITVNVKSESGVIMGDPVQIQQVLMNLATNAAHAMREKGGKLDIELSDFSVSSSNAETSGMEPGIYMKMVVRDTGTGISPEIIDRIFDPFFTTKKVGEGTGLGLSVVLGIVRQARGYVTVESAPGSGSTFTVYFPKAVQEEAAEGTAADETVPTGHERILFIDDEEVLAEMGEDLLAELGYEVTYRPSSREALALFRLDPSFYDLVITDQTMPDLTGIELAREMLAIRPGLPIILATGFSHSVDEANAKAAGIKAFVLKPLTKKEIAKAVRKVLDME